MKRVHCDEVFLEPLFPEVYECYKSANRSETSDALLAFWEDLRLDTKRLDWFIAELGLTEAREREQSDIEWVPNANGFRWNPERGIMVPFLWDGTRVQLKGKDDASGEPERDQMPWE